MRYLFEFIKRYNFVFLFLLLEVVAIVLLAQSTFYQNSRLVTWANAVSGRWNQGVGKVTHYFSLKEENDRLAAENATLRAQVAASFIHYTDSVFTIDDTVYHQRYSYTEAQIIKRSRNGQRNYLMINKGQKQGVRPDMAVISPQGVVGVVVNTTANFATVMPILHPESRNSVKVKRINSSGTLLWEGGDYRFAVVTDIPTTHQLYKNDTIITSGFAHDFPEGIPVGYVESLASLSGTGFYKLTIRLATDFANLDHVYIIDNHFKAEQESLMRLTQEGAENKR
ncbi:MAG: rod shape-determining protein MreC [Bacteroidales bacterium]|nr:rod shape-determining protein MreC [Bacteroidales bacterium]